MGIYGTMANLAAVAKLTTLAYTSSGLMQLWT